MSVAVPIKPTLAQIEKDRVAEIGFAVERGSRVWGFESTDSDVCFVHLSTQ